MLLTVCDFPPPFMCQRAKKKEEDCISALKVVGSSPKTRNNQSNVLMVIVYFIGLFAASVTFVDAMFLLQKVFET